MTIKKMRRFIRMMAWYPPYIGTGVRITHVNDSATSYTVEMALRWYNRNIYGSHFGGSLYSMCDPWFAFAVSAHFGKDYIIWDKSASIDYISPGKGTVRAEFSIPLSELESMKEEVDHLGKNTYTFETNVMGQDDNIVAHVVKEIYIRKK